MNAAKTGVRLIGVTGWFECDGSGVHHEVCSFLSDGRATKSAVVCDSWEQAEQVLRDHETMEALRAIARAWSLEERSMQPPNDMDMQWQILLAALLPEVLDATKEADSE